MAAKKMDVYSWNAVFQWGSVALVAVTFFVGAGALVTRNKISRLQTERLVALETDLTRAQESLSKQQERTAAAERTLENERQARLTLDRRTANRWLEPDVFNQLASDMAKFRGQPADVVVFPVNFESVGIANLIHGILGNAKWNAGLSARQLTEAPQLPTPAGTMAPIMVQGVYIQASADEASKTAGRALYDALSTTVASGVFDATSLPGEPRVFVLIGDRPTPLSVWVNK